MKRIPYLSTIVKKETDPGDQRLIKDQVRIDIIHIWDMQEKIHVQSKILNDMIKGQEIGRRSLHPGSEVIETIKSHETKIGI